MKYVALLLRNLKSFITTKPLFFVIFCAGQIASVIVFLLAVGVLRELEAEKNNYTDQRTVFWAYKGETDDGVQIDIFRKKSKELIDMVESGFEGIDLFGYIPNVDNSDFISDIPTKERLEDNKSNITFTYDQFYSDEKIVIVGENYKGDLDEPFVYNGEDYKIVGRGVLFDPIIPIKALPSEACVSSIQLRLTSTISKQKSHEIVEKLKEIFGKKVTVEVPDSVDLLMLQSNNMINFASVVAIIIILINVLICYMYMLRLRKSYLAIIRLIGCSRKKEICLLGSELMVILVTNVIIGAVIFKNIILEILIGINPFFGDIYYVGECVKLEAVFCAITMLMFIVALMIKVKGNVKEVM